MTYRPSANVSILLVFYDMVNNNERFVDHIVKSIVKFPIPQANNQNPEDGKESSGTVRGINSSKFLMSKFLLSEFL